LDVLQSELGFTIPLLVEYPKCYWIWKYRLWILQQAIERLDVSVARRVWEEELSLASKMLTRDRRNFHAWGYRRHVVARLESSDLNGESMVEAEFEYTTRMIRVDLSNFSAWHNRSRLILRLLHERGADDLARRSFLDEGEFPRFRFRAGAILCLVLTHHRTRSHPGSAQRRPGRPIPVVLSPIPHAKFDRLRWPSNNHA
jgi:hypothetical protein